MVSSSEAKGNCSSPKIVIETAVSFPIDIGDIVLKEMPLKED
jgi:hypothetical protein